MRSTSLRLFSSASPNYILAHYAKIQTLKLVQNSLEKQYLDNLAIAPATTQSFNAVEFFRARLIEIEQDILNLERQNISIISNRK